ncbi:MAG: hypothetical protein MPW15_21745 [Candidatus Manganitrophus sp.]|nr:hypothetical protein [Candidatus Manganitrophus sp.]
MIHWTPFLLYRMKGSFTSILFLIFLTGCASFSVDQNDHKAQIRISNGAMGSGLELNPPILKIEPGETVSWNNFTTYDLRIQIESGLADVRSPLLHLALYDG